MNHGRKMRLSQKIRYALSDMRFRKTLSLLNTLSVALGSAYILLLGFYGYSIYTFQRTVLATSLPTLVIAECPNITDRKLRFSEEKLTNLQQLPQVELAYPRVEIGVRLSAMGNQSTMVPAEGADSRAPLLAREQLVWGEGLRKGETRKIVLSESLFKKMGGSVTGGKLQPQDVRLQVSRTVNERPEKMDYVFHIAGLLRYQTVDKVYIPLEDAINLDRWCSNKKGGLEPGKEKERVYEDCLVYCQVPQRQRLEEEAQQQEFTLEYVGDVQNLTSSGPIYATVTMQDGSFPTNRQQGFLNMKGMETQLLVSRILFEGTGENQISFEEIKEGDPRCMLLPGHRIPEEDQVVSMRKYDRERVPFMGVSIRVVGEAPGLPAKGDFLCSTSYLESLITRNRKSEGKRNPVNLGWSHVVFAKDLSAYFRCQQYCREERLLLKPLVTLNEETLIAFHVREKNRKDGMITESFLSFLRNLKPSVRYAYPVLRVPVTSGGQKIKLLGSDEGDPSRFGSNLLCGRWLSDSTQSNHNEVVLSKDVVENLFSASGLVECLHKVLEVEVRTESTVASREDHLKIPLEVVGITEGKGKSGITSFDLLRELADWRMGTRVYNETKRVFEEPAVVYEKSGFIRCNLYAKTPGDVPTLVARLESEGYTTQHNLAQQQGLQRLGNVMVFLVAFFGLGTLFNAAITVFVSTLMNIRSRRFEIGILRAHGVGGREILSIYAFQGFFIGVLAAVIAIATVILMEPYLRSLISTSFHFQMSSFITQPILSKDLWWLYTCATGTGLLFSLMGVLFPALTAVRLSPAESLQFRE